MTKNTEKEESPSESSFLFSTAIVNLKILFVDVAISILRVASEFLNGYAFLVAKDTRQYGIISFAISMLPGLVAAVHFMTHASLNQVWSRRQRKQKRQ